MHKRKILQKSEIPLSIIPPNSQLMRFQLWYHSRHHIVNDAKHVVPITNSLHHFPPRCQTLITKNAYPSRICILTTFFAPQIFLQIAWVFNLIPNIPYIFVADFCILNKIFFVFEIYSAIRLWPPTKFNTAFAISEHRKTDIIIFKSCFSIKFKCFKKII